MPQILILNHAAWVNSERMKSKLNKPKDIAITVDTKDPIVMNGKRMSQLNSEELSAYYSNL